MRRKLVKQGTSTLMVSLPIKWVKENKAQKGSEIDIEAVGNNLIISTGGIEAKSETEIKLINLTESSIRTLITNTYRRGYDKVKVFYDKPSQFKILNEITKTKLLGFEIVQKGKGYCIIENITEPTADQFDTILKKIFYNITELFEITKDRINNNIKNDEFVEVEERIQRFDNFCRRVISKRRIQADNSEFLWLFMSLMFQGQREIYHLNNKLLNNKTKVPKEITKLLEANQEIFELIKKSYLNKDIHLLAKVHEKEKELLYWDGYNLLKNKTGKEALMVYHLMASIRNFYLANSPLSGLIM